MERHQKKNGNGGQLSRHHHQCRSITYSHLCTLLTSSKKSLRGSGRFRYAAFTLIVPNGEDKGEALEAKWKEWTVEESYKRYASNGGEQAHSPSFDEYASTIG